MSSVDRTKYMSASEVQQLRTVTQAAAIVDLAEGRRRGPLAWMLVDLALGTGLRVCEIAALTVSDVDLKRQLLRIVRRKKREKVPGEYITVDGKRKPVYRPLRVKTSLPIDDELVAHLRDYIENQRQTGDSDSLWIGKQGAITAQGLELIWRGAVVRAGLINEAGAALYSIHSARHTAAFHLLRKTGNLRHVQKQLGHSNPSTTANMYADICDEDMRAGMSGLYEPK